ncbi:hypothetical protein [Nitrobacter sp.]|uniref:hypothetical protein n=1 Tax=Nitrobacter sp. TaxID=29420 RepID=UPI0029CAAEE8|nr:hypothetical protein [Nitrobacter sp.]
MSDTSNEFRAPEVPNYAAAPGVGVIDFPSLPEGTKVTTTSFTASDGAGSRGVLYQRGGEKTVVCISHPRADVSQHYAIPKLLEAGYAAYSHQCRGLNNDVDCVHEKLLLDLAGGFSHLKNTLGFEKIILLGNSGGGSLFSFYQQQATLQPPNRRTDTAAGDPCDLNAVEMPKADGLVLLAVHPGEGLFMLAGIDPSIVDENDPLSVDPTLDMYNPANGFRMPPEQSSYSPEFLERYRAAQRARVERLDGKAKFHVAEQARYKAMMEAPGFDKLPLDEQIYITRRAVVGHYMIIYRTEANPAYCDLSIKSWRSTRLVGSIIGPRPDKLNYTEGGFSRYITPRGWLSSWSGLSSRAAIVQTIKDVDVPLLCVAFTGDNGCFPIDNKEQVDACKSTDKSMEFVAAEHYGRPLEERFKGADYIVAWLKERFPAAQ